jgi:hypothetical protein
MRLRSSHHVPHALGERRGLRWAARVGFAPHAPHARRRASPLRFAPRTCTPAPSRAPNCDARSMRPQSRTDFSDFFRHFRTPKIWVGVGPLAGLCSSAIRSRRAGQEGGRQQEGGRSGGTGPPPDWMCCVSVALPRHVLMCSLISNNLSFTHECAMKDPRHAIAHACACAY